MANKNPMTDEHKEKIVASRKRFTEENRKLGETEAQKTGEELIPKKEILKSVYTQAEAAEKWGITVQRVHKACVGFHDRGRNTPSRFAAIEARHAGTNWLITDAGMRRVFGEPKGDEK